MVKTTVTWQTRGRGSYVNIYMYMYISIYLYLYGKTLAPVEDGEDDSHLDNRGGA